MKKTPLKSKHGFRTPTIEQVREKQEKARIKKGSGFRTLKSTKRRLEGNKTILVGSQKPKKRKKLPPLKKLRDKADSLLTPLCKKLSPNCESCGKETQVGHHWIEKSRSSFLRYDMRNLIALCNSCHAKIHNRFGNSVVGGLDVAEIIINKRGRAWKEQLDLDQPKYQKVNRDFYIENHTHLTQLLEE